MRGKGIVAANELKQETYDFIVQNRAAALATVGADGVPHVAHIYVIVRPDLSMYFSTRVESRKYRNLSFNSKVAMSFANEKDMAAVQLTGIAKRVNNLAIEQEILHDLILLRYAEPNWPVPPVKLFEEGATNELAIIKVTPIELTSASFETNETGRYHPFFRTVIRQPQPSQEVNVARPSYSTPETLN